MYIRNRNCIAKDEVAYDAEQEVMETDPINAGFVASSVEHHPEARILWAVTTGFGEEKAWFGTTLRIHNLITLRVFLPNTTTRTLPPLPAT